MAEVAGGCSLLGNLPARNPGLFSQYNHELSGRQAAPRLTAAPAPASGAPTVVRSEGTSVLVRELEKAHLRSKALLSHKRAKQASALQRKQPRRGRQQQVAPQPEPEAGADADAEVAAASGGTAEGAAPQPARAPQPAAPQAGPM